MSKKNRQRVDRIHRRLVGMVAYAAVLVVVLGVAGVLLVRALRSPALVPLTGNVVDVAANMSGFDKPELHVKAGEPVSVRLTSLDNQHHTDGGGQHQWAVDEFGVNVVAQPLSSNTVTFTPEKPG